MHKLQMYEDLRDMLEKEVKDIQKKGDLDVQGLDNLYKLMTAIKVTDRCIEREKGEKPEAVASNMVAPTANAYTNRRYSRMMPPEPTMAMGNTMANTMGNTYAEAAYADMANEADKAYADGVYDGIQSERRGGRRGRDGDNDGRYNESRDNFRNSQDRGRSYEAYDGRSYEYSRDATKKKMVQKLETLMDDTMSETERKAIMECIEKIK